MTMRDSVEGPVAQPGRDAVSNMSRKGDQSRQRRLEAALIEFGAAGFKSATTRRIAERAKTTLPPLNYYFGSKEELFRECVRLSVDANIAECERIVRDVWRLPAMRMTVIDVRDELIAFYQRRGYRRTGITKPFPYGDVRFGEPKRDDLRFEVLEKAL